MDFGLHDRVLLVTGGGSGIGKAVVEMAARQGMQTAILDINADAARQLAERLRARGCPSTAIGCDVRDATAIARAVEEVESSLGPIDGLVTSAGVSRPSPAEDMPREGWNA
ncbi:MAG: SDR family NAD(P)-dependent oxidoreductase, partial [Burkholderiales bacterium]|nr:SDR family NAD(P)-dependent oxidoreductase [Burkholderiales bacterium]